MLFSSSAGSAASPVVSSSGSAALASVACLSSSSASTGGSSGSVLRRELPTCGAFRAATKRHTKRMTTEEANPTGVVLPAGVKPQNGLMEPLPDEANHRSDDRDGFHNAFRPAPNQAQWPAM